MSSPGMVRLWCENPACGHYDTTFEHFFYRSYNEMAEGQPMPADAVRDLTWATCPECGTAHFWGGPEVISWDW